MVIYTVQIDEDDHRVLTANGWVVDGVLKIPIREARLNELLMSKSAHAPPVWTPQMDSVLLLAMEAHKDSKKKWIEILQEDKLEQNPVFGGLTGDSLKSRARVLKHRQK